MESDPRLEELFRREYSLNVLADPEGGYVIVYPDLPGCMSQIDTLDELPQVADEIRKLWIETQYFDGDPIPEPFDNSYSGRFNVRIPSSLHRRLAEHADREGVSLNQYVVALLERNDAIACVERRLDALEGKVKV